MPAFAYFFYFFQSFFVKNPGRIQIGITDKCNLSCEMCPRSVFVSGKDEMQIESFKTVLEKIPMAKIATLTGWGEPLLHSKIFEMIKLCKSRDLKVKLTTNGILLNENRLKNLLESGIDSISFSIDGTDDDNSFGHQNSKVLKTISDLIGLRGSQKKPSIAVQTTLHAGFEKSIFGLIEQAAELGVDKVNICRLDLRHNNSLKRPSFADEKVFFKTAKALGKSRRVIVEMAPYPSIESVEKAFTALSMNFFNQENFCIRTIDYLYIRPDGKVTPCCSLPNYIVGNIADENSSEIWKGDKMNFFRKNQAKICSGCDVFKKNYCKN